VIKKSVRNPGLPILVGKSSLQLNRYTSSCTLELVVCLPAILVPCVYIKGISLASDSFMKRQAKTLWKEVILLEAQEEQIQQQLFQHPPNPHFGI